MELTKLVIVALISLSPVGEELIAIPAGAAMGLPVFLVAAVAAAANFLPVPVIMFIFDRGNRYPRIHGWLLGRRNDRVKRWMDKYGIAGLLVLTPWIGVYAAAMTCGLLGMQRSKIYASIGASLLIYAFIAALLLTVGIRLL